MKLPSDGSDGQPTLEQVAALAGVSRATVSRVVNGSPRVSAAAREAVQRAIEQLGYVPNRAARTLVTRRTDSIALVVSEPEARVFGEPFFAGIVRGASQALAATDLQLVLLMAQGAAQRAKLERYLVAGHVDGVLLVSLHGDDPLPRALSGAGVPAVFCGRPLAPLDLSRVDADNRGGARAAVQHLLARGRRRIATITGPLDMGVGVDRLEGWREALEEAGVEPAGRLVAHGDFSQESGAEGMRALLERAPDIDAVFAASDLMAASALRVLKAARRRVPDDVAVVGFEDSEEIAQTTEPRLTTVRQPVERMGQEMTRLLLEQMAGERGGGRVVILDTELVLRESA